VAIETAAVRLVVRKNAPLRSLERIIGRMEAAAKRNDFAAVVACEFAFHEELFAIAGNQYLVATFRSLAAQIRMALSLDNRTFPNLFDVVDEHVALLEALKTADEADAAHAIQAHIVSTIGAVLDAHGIGTEALLAPLTN
jgi:DNA-binding GntR family transcriptional regulator